MQKPKVINVGTPLFAQSLQQQGVEVLHVDWRPPAGGNPRLAAGLAKLEGRPEIEAANREALERLLSAHPVLVDVGIAGELIPGMTRKTILHSGPPVTWERMCGPQRGAVMGALMLEGLAASPEEAAALAGSGEIIFRPNNEVGAIGPMAGVISHSFAVCVVRNEAHGNLAYTNLNEGYGKVLRMGAFAPEVLEKLKWINTELAGTIKAGLQATGSLDLRAIIAQALHMGDEVHNRNKAAGALFVRALGPAMLRSGMWPQAIAKALEFLGGNEVFFVNLSMAACKAALDAAHNIRHSTLVSCMSRNGTDFGIRISGLGDRWFTGPAQMVEGLYFPGFTAADANPDMGDSVITETAGVGGFAMAAAPAIVQFVGGTVEKALEATQQMYEITVAENRYYTIPYLGFRGTPTGIDLRKVVATGVLPHINTGIAHKEPGVGQVGAGIVKPPANVFEDAIVAMAEQYG
jgi:hypothetical protein